MKMKTKGKGTMPRSVLTSLAVGVFLWIGCGNQQGPLSPGQPSGIQNTAGRARLSFSAPAAERAAKPVRNMSHSQSVSGLFRPERSGRLSVRFKEYALGNEVQVKSATFSVKRGAVLHPVVIGMKVSSGTTLQDVTIDFSPSGLQFSPKATLTLKLLGDLDPANLTVSHIRYPRLFAVFAGRQLIRLSCRCREFRNFLDFRYMKCNIGP